MSVMPELSAVLECCVACRRGDLTMQRGDESQKAGAITVLSGSYISSAKYREWQRYRGWTLKILEELEHSGGMTTREISTRIENSCRRVTSTLCRMANQGLVERVERWGWKITRDGIFLLSINYANTTTTQQQHNANTMLTQEKEERAPICFYASTCHIKRFCQDKRYIAKNMYQCHGCVWNTPDQWNKPTVPLEKKDGGSIQAPLVQERLQHV